MMTESSDKESPSSEEEEPTPPPEHKHKKKKKKKKGKAKAKITGKVFDLAAFPSHPSRQPLKHSGRGDCVGIRDTVLDGGSLVLLRLPRDVPRVARLAAVVVKATGSAWGMVSQGRHLGSDRG